MSRARDIANLQSGAIINEAGADLDFRIESDGNANIINVDAGNDRVGIGMIPDTTILTVNGQVGTTNGSESAPTHTFYSDADTGMFRAAANTLAFSTGGSERTRIDSSGNVGIGTSPSDKLEIQGGGADGIRLSVSGQSYYHKIRSNGDGLLLSADDSNAGGSGADIRFQVGGTEHMRLVDDGHLFISKTSSALATVGSELLNDGRIVGTADGQDVLLLNRKSSHGDIIDFYKDGSIVGNIGSASVGGLEVTGNNSSKSLILTTNFFPGDGAGAKNDNSIDLGISDARWKDLYLGGGVYVGGTGSANYLDDYEEGTWTAQLTDGTNDVDLTTSAVYTKIGNLVTVSFDKYNVSISSLNTSDLSIKTLPFPSNANSHGNKIIHVTGTSSGANTPVLVYPVNTATALALYKAVSSSQNMAQLTKSDLGSSISIRLTLTYFTNS